MNLIIYVLSFMFARFLKSNRDVRLIVFKERNIVLGVLTYSASAVERGIVVLTTNVSPYMGENLRYLFSPPVDFLPSGISG